MQIPQFVVHDVLENIEEKALKEAVRIANDSSFQYIAAMLHSKLESTGFTKQQLNDMVVLTLSEGDKLFKDSHSWSGAIPLIARNSGAKQWLSFFEWRQRYLEQRAFVSSYVFMRSNNVWKARSRSKVGHISPVML